MPSTYAIYTGDGSTKNFAILFTYLNEDFVKVSVDGVDTSFMFLSEFLAQLETAPASRGALSASTVRHAGRRPHRHHPLQWRHQRR